jgi:hypothetical protein
VISAVTVTGADDPDSLEFPHLLNQTSKRFRALEVMADKGYCSADNYRAVEDVGAVPYISFLSQAAGGRGSAFLRAYHFYQLERKKFKELYNRRSNAEAAHSMLKRRFKGPLSFRSLPAIENEVLGMVLVHNIRVLIQSMFELGIDPDFQ